MSLTGALKRIAEKRGVEYGEFRKASRNQKTPRQKFKEAIDNNIRLLKDPEFRYRRNGTMVKPTAWWDEAEDGSLAIRPRYGITLLIEGEALYAKDKEKAIAVLNDLADAADAGEFDKELKAASDEARQKLADAKNGKAAEQKAA